jgi:hypothetical protein
MENKRQAIELASIAAGYIDQVSTSPDYALVQKKALRAIVQCRTSALGGHLAQCTQCNYSRQSYNSCRNRHCPKCQFARKAQWVDRLKGNLPPVKYFHLVFTVPRCLHKLFYINQRLAYGLLFQASGEALQHCASKMEFLGARAGAVGILHTWGQTLTYHPHIHMIVPAGGLSEDGLEWIASGSKFFVPVKLLSRVFRSNLTKKLEQAWKESRIQLPDGHDQFNTIRKLCYAKEWVVYSEKPFSSPDRLISYLGNYTHRVAISNHRLVDHSNGKVQFRYKDYRDGGRRKHMVLPDQEFMRRFLQHVLPQGMSKIRYYGFLSLRNIKASLDQCLEALGRVIDLPELQGLSGLELYDRLTGKNPLVCPRCSSGQMRIGLPNRNKDPA